MLALAACATFGERSATAFVPPNKKIEAARGDMAFVGAATIRFLAEAKWGGTVPGSLPAYGADPAGYNVHVNSFYMDRTEVTAGAYATCVQAGACPALDSGDGVAPNHTPLCTYGRAGLERHPLNCVGYVEATKYCSFAGKRLPTEAEWELAARGLTGRPFPWGDAYPTPKHLNGCDASLQREAPAKLNETFTSMWGDTGDDGWAFTAPVGTYPDGASAYGVLDLSGNVEEWVGDAWWDPAPGGGPPKAPVSNPTNDFIVRGGAWDLNSADSFAATRRLRTEAGTRAAWLGFRCARDG